MDWAEGYSYYESGQRQRFRTARGRLALSVGLSVFEVRLLCNGWYQPLENADDSVVTIAIAHFAAELLRY